jgi:hypothetical protein
VTLTLTQDNILGNHISNPHATFKVSTLISKKLELRESDVSPCEQCSLGEMARTKMKYEKQQRAITKKMISAEQHICALNFLSIRSIIL